MGHEIRLNEQARTRKISVVGEPYFSQRSGLRILRIVNWGRERQSFLGIRLTKLAERPNWKMTDVFDIAALIDFCRLRGEEPVVYVTKAAKPEVDFAIIPAVEALESAIAQITERLEAQLARTQDFANQAKLRQEMDWWRAEVEDLTYKSK